MRRKTFGLTMTVGPAATVWVGYGLLAPATEAQTQTIPPVSALDRDAGVELADFADQDQESVISDNDFALPEERCRIQRFVDIFVSLGE